ncbi:hypothetical protein [Enterocloster bolteae]|mgnify:CR=1 FL=1|uniref:Uncharacterized protein n=1 Tax=Enterocloster bolteae TaxID=208479 RepID=A0A412ZBT0_9FIRM|nr:hypothetical protein [Enterocloster bolteae]RGV77579.1 hypothetical protein DWW02_07920 [Enterocloster bolteae]
MATASNCFGNGELVMDLGRVVYIISIALQLTAGLLLLLGNTKTTKKEIISKFCTQHRWIFIYPDGSLRDYEELVKVAKTVWVNKIAFFYLILGYSTSVFSDAPSNKLFSFIGIIILSVIITRMSYKFADYKSHKCESIDFKNCIPDKGTAIISVDFPQKD